MIADFDMRGGAIGDTLLPEPALSALAAQRGESVKVWIENEKSRSLYLNNPAIVLVDEPCGHEILPLPAFHEAHRSRAYFATGFFPFVGAKWFSGTRTTCRVYVPEFDESAPWQHEVIIFPYALCHGENRRPAREWWAPISRHFLARSGRLPFCLGGVDDVPIPGMMPLLGLPLRASVHALLTAKLVITTDSWPLHVCGGRAGPTIVLSAATPDFFVKAGRVTVLQSPTEAPSWSADDVILTISKLLGR